MMGARRVSIATRLATPGLLTATPAVDPHETPLLAVPVAELDETYIGTAVLIVGRHAAVAGGISDLQHLQVGDAFEYAGHVGIALAPMTQLWVGGHTALATDACDRVLAAPPPAALEAP